MQLFNEESFSALLTHCYENEEYQGVVMLQNEAQKRELMEELFRNHNESPITGVRSIITRMSHTYVEFENGSEIEIITPNDLHRMRGHRFNEALLDNAILDFDAINALEHLIVDYHSAVNQGMLRRRRRTFADMMRGDFDKRSMGKWGASTNPDVEIKVDKKSKEVIDDFLDSFKINNSLEFGA